MLSIGIYLALMAAVAAAAWVLLIDVRSLASAGMLVSAEPLRAPMEAALLVLGFFFAITAAVSVARERESGTLEVLFYGPVDEITYVLGKAGGLLLAYVAALPVLWMSLWLLSLGTGFLLTSAIPTGLLLSAVPAAEIICFGLLLAIGSMRIRSTVLVLAGVTVLMMGITVANQVLSMVPISDPSSPLLSLRDALATGNGVIRSISPFACLDRIVDGALGGTWRAIVLDLVMTVVITASMTAVAAIWLRRKGIAGGGE